LVGSDLNLAHRLAKNSVTGSTGVRAYATFTAAAVDGLGGTATATRLQRSRSRFPTIFAVAFVDLSSPAADLSG
jgi:hypothetical protein